jgi:hypothetical protein
MLSVAAFIFIISKIYFVFYYKLSKLVMVFAFVSKLTLNTRSHLQDIFNPSTESNSLRHASQGIKKWQKMVTLM